MFLLAAEDFRKFFEEAPAANAAANAATAYKRFVTIVDEYIREHSPYEVNIESKTKGKIIRTTDRRIFDELMLVRPSNMPVPRPKQQN